MLLLTNISFLPCFWYFIIVLWAAQVTSQALLIDDHLALLPGVAWVVGCGVCKSAVKPLDPTQLSTGTLYSTLFNVTSSAVPQNATIQFYGKQPWDESLSGHLLFIRLGTKIDVIGVLFTEFQADYLFYIDSRLSGSFSFTGATPPRTFLYNQTFYSNNTLLNETHVLQVQNGRLGGDSSLIMLDSFSFDV